MPRFSRIPATTMLARLQGVRRVYWMTYVAATDYRIWSGHGLSFSGLVALVIVALASGVATWATDAVTWVPALVSSNDTNASSFDARFVAGAASNSLSMDLSRAFVPSLPSELEIKFQQAKARLAQKLQSQDRRGGPARGTAPANGAAASPPPC